MLDLTVRELSAYARGADQKRDDDWRRAMWAAWHAAAFSRSKRVPNLERILRRIGRRQVDRKTPAQLLRIVEKINALFDGEDRRKEK